MSTPGLIETLARLLGDALSPLAQRLQGNGVEEVIEQLGLRLPSGSLSSGNVTAALQASANACGQLPLSVAELVAAISGSDDVAMITAAETLAQRIIQAVTAFTQLSVALDNVVQGAGGLTPAQTTRLRAAAQAVPERLLHLAFISYLEDKQPGVKGALDLAGIFDDVPVPGDPADASLPPHHLKRIRFDRLGPLVNDPVQHLKNLYGFGRPDFDGLELFRRVKAMVDRPEAEAIIITAPGQPAALEAFIFRLAVAPGAIPGLRIRVRAAAERDVDVAVPLGGPWSATTNAQARFQSGLEFVLHPQTGLHIEPPAAAATVALALGVKAENADGRPMILIGQAGGSRLELQRFSSRLPMQLSASAGAPSPDVKLSAAIGLEKGKLVIDTSQSDGFIATILSGVKVEAPFDVSAIYDTDHGLRFSGSAAIEILIPAHLSLGPISIPNISLIGGFQDGAIPIEFSADIGAQLGPISATVNRLGANAKVTFPKGGGNAGPLQIDVTFKPPNGVGLSVDAGVIKGGGFLSIDVARGEYAGALELSFSGVIALKAIAIINTKMPDGSTGFALLVLITAEFAPIQLGFGFTLVGVGGLLALNRRLDTEALRVGVRTGALNSILFPQDIIANITRIISDIKNIFPLASDHFVIGPMGKLGWGTPTLLSLEIGVIIDLPTPAIVIAGVLRASLPAEDLPILNLQVNFAGGIDFEKGLIWFDASLYDSHLLIYTLTGDMALRIGWGDQAILILTVGGFHPAFNEIPPDLRGLRRLGISLLSGDNPRLSCQTYFAITSNTVQSGSRVELYAEGCGLNIYGFLGYDLLVQFNPFHFIADLEAGLALRDGTDELMGIHVHGELSGPNPFRARGEASIDLWLFSISIDFDVTWGDDAAAQIEAEVEVLPLIEAALKDDRNWLATLPANTHQNVTLKKLQLPPEQIVLNPFAVLSVSQKVVPLGLEINKFGNQKPKGTTRFELTFAEGTTEEVREEFAIANFQHLNDSEKLSSKSFDKMRSGLRFSVGDSSQTGANTAKDVTYELSYVHRKRGLTIRAGLVRLFGSVFSMFSGAGAVTKNKFAVSRRIGGTPIAKVDVKKPEFQVVNQSDLAMAGPGLSAKTSTEAWQLHDELVAANPSLSGRLQVMSTYELSDAA